MTMKLLIRIQSGIVAVIALVCFLCHLANPESLEYLLLGLFWLLFSGAGFYYSSSIQLPSSRSYAAGETTKPMTNPDTAASKLTKEEVEVKSMDSTSISI